MINVTPMCVFADLCQGEPVGSVNGRSFCAEHDPTGAPSPELEEAKARVEKLTAQIKQAEAAGHIPQPPEPGEAAKGGGVSHERARCALYEMHGNGYRELHRYIDEQEAALRAAGKLIEDYGVLLAEGDDRERALQRRVEEWQKQANQADALRMGLHDRITALEAALAEAEEKLTEARRLAWQHGAEAIMAHIGFDEGKRDKLHRKNPYRDQRAPNVWCAPAGAKAPALEGVDLAQLADGRREGGPLNTERGRGDRPSESMSEPAAEIRGNVVASPTRSARAEARSDDQACYWSQYQSSGIPCPPGQCPNGPPAQPPQPGGFGPDRALWEQIVAAVRGAELDAKAGGYDTSRLTLSLLADRLERKP